MSDGKKIVITGIGGQLGRHVARRIHRMGRYEVVGIDRRPISDLPKDITHLKVDLRSKRAREVFRRGDVEALIHLGIMHNPRASESEHHNWNVMGTAKLLHYCLEYKVPKVVVLSSASKDLLLPSKLDIRDQRRDQDDIRPRAVVLVGDVCLTALRELDVRDVHRVTSSGVHNDRHDILTLSLI